MGSKHNGPFDKDYKFMVWPEETVMITPSYRATWRDWITMILIGVGMGVVVGLFLAGCDSPIAPSRVARVHPIITIEHP